MDASRTARAAARQLSNPPATVWSNTERNTRVTVERYSQRVHTGSSRVTARQRAAGRRPAGAAPAEGGCPDVPRARRYIRESFSRVKRTWSSSAALPSVPLWPCAGSTHYARRLRHRLCSACRERSSESRGNLAGSRMIEAGGRHGEAVRRTHKMLHGRSRVHDSLYYLHSACYKTLQ